MSFFGLFGGGNDGAAIEAYLKEGAVVIDVRTVEEFASGHVNGSKNIVLNSIPSKIAEIKVSNKFTDNILDIFESNRKKIGDKRNKSAPVKEAQF